MTVSRVKHSVHHSIYNEQPHSISDQPAGTVTWSWPWTEEDGQHFCFAVQQCRREEKLNLAESVVLWTKMIVPVFVHSVHLYKKENRAIRSPFVQWSLYYLVNMNEICPKVQIISYCSGCLQGWNKCMMRQSNNISPKPSTRSGMTSTYQPDVPMEEFQVQVLCSVHLYQKELMRLNCVMSFEMI